MKHLLLATDGSDHASAALEVTAAIARDAEADVFVVHVVTDRQPDEDARRAVEVEYADELVERCRSALLLHGQNEEAELANLLVSRQHGIAKVINSILGESVLSHVRTRLEALGVSRVTTLLADGEPAERLLELAAEQGCDTIVLGCRGLGRVAEVLLGSTSQSVAHRAKCRVIIVK